MTEANDLRSRLVIGQKRDGRREYDEEARAELIRLCLNRGVSIARTAMERHCGACRANDLVQRSHCAICCGHPYGDVTIGCAAPVDNVSGAACASIERRRT
jgi:hypothetical protein